MFGEHTHHILQGHKLMVVALTLDDVDPTKQSLRRLVTDAETEVRPIDEGQTDVLLANEDSGAALPTPSVRAEGQRPLTTA